MSRREDLVAEAEKLRTELGIAPISVDSLSNAKLDQVVSNLRKKVADKSEPTVGADIASVSASEGAAAEEQPEAAEEQTAEVAADAARVDLPESSEALAPEVAEPRYVVARGHGVAVTGKILGSGETITADQLGGGEVSLNELVRAGVVERTV